MVEPARPRRVSVIIPARNAATTLDAQLKAFSQQDFQGWWELIVVDNGSSDKTANVAKAWQTKLPCLRIINAPASRGLSGARNTGAAAARGNILLFCDADDVATSSWLRAMASAARTADVVGGYRDLYQLNTPRIRSWSPPFPAGLPIGLGYLPYAPGSCLGVRMEIFSSLGGFDESYASGGEDLDFSWRAQLASYTISFAPDAVMHYRLRNRLWPLTKQAYRNGQANAQLLRKFRPHGVPAVSALDEAKGWYWQLRRLPHLASRDRAGLWWFRTAWHVGRLVGRIRYRVS